ncbi:unnamed protein product [Paramecium sonneborni]|uniref:Uncharacterized protein n=1 Tax=Paramecium sonneborni TaxID=65129 RepID=A0A8S1KFM7_9CILI|nr:unnamed protein product [Paramecium sonneborni]
MNQEQKYQHDYTVDIKELQVINRQQSLVWNTMIESYQKKLNHLQKKLMIEKAQKNFNQSQQEINQLYKKQCQAAADSYELDLFEIRKAELNKRFDLEKAILNEQLNENKKTYEQIKQKQQPPQLEKPKECQFITGAYSDYTLVLALRKSINQCEQINQKTFISLQSFYPECYISNFQDCENISVIAIKDISHQATKNSIKNNLILANADYKILNCYKVSYDKEKLNKDLIFQEELDHNIDLIHITNTQQIIAISKLRGFIYLLNKNYKQLIYQGDHVIGESVYYEKEDKLRVFNQHKIVTISNLQTRPKYDELLTDQYKALIYFQTNLPNFHLQYIQHPQIINDQYFVYVKQQNKIRIYDYQFQQKKQFKVQTQNIQVEFLNFFAKTNKIVFCDSQGQTYKVEKFTNLIG